jgi:hypothetical protein
MGADIAGSGPRHPETSRPRVQPPTAGLRDCKAAEAPLGSPITRNHKKILPTMTVLRSNEIIQKARDTSGLEHFDSESFREGLGRAVEGVNSKATRTAKSAAWCEDRLVEFLATRLKIADYIRKHPALLEKPVEAPIIVLGMPRTGSTLLSNLLNADTSLRSLLRWEAHDPVPPPTQEGLHNDPRYLKLLAEEQAINPLQRMHHEPWGGPTECHAILSQDCKSAGMEPVVASPDYGNWILECDMAPTYRYHRMVLQMLQSQTSGRWSLKLPSHALNIRTVMATYPDAKIIWTHRDPYQVTGSFMSMMETVQKMHLSEVDTGYIAHYYPKRLREHVVRPMAVQDESGSDPFYHLFYGDLVRDPIGQMRKLYAWLGLPYTDATEERTKAWLADNPRGKFGAHDYGLERFGLSVEGLKPFFQDYLERFDIEREN